MQKTTYYGYAMHYGGQPEITSIFISQLETSGPEQNISLICSYACPKKMVGCLLK